MPTRRDSRSARGRSTYPVIQCHYPTVRAVSFETVQCPVCGVTNDDAARFCNGCAAVLRPATPTGGPRHERKLVTVVFCDLVGFTGRAESMDPEDVRVLLSDFHGHVRDELQRYGGTVEKFIGDAVVAVFGAPTVHEDDAERAVRAAVAVRDWAREQNDVEVRLAVNTGEALVSLDVDAAAGEGMVAGDVINTASRIQSAAPINGVLVGEQTYRSTRDRILYTGHEPIAAKGKANPVAVWEAMSARSRVRAGDTGEARSPFVGRERELAMLRDAFERMRSYSEPQLVTLVGVPGAGKSRLLAELGRLVDADPDLVTWRGGRCLPYGDGVSYWALAEIVKAEAGILDNDPPELAAAKLADAVRALLPAADADWVERDLRPLVGFAATNGRDAVRADAAFPAWARFLESLAERAPTVIVVEDLHWADDGLLDFLDDFAGGASGLPLLVIGTARPELLVRRPQWGGGKTNAVTLSLPPLSEADTARIVDALLPGPQLSAERAAELIERAGGNPLYAEEFARMLAEGGDRGLAIPETVQGIVAARLDGLARAQKRLLQDASVVGTVFWLGSVEAMGILPRAEVEAAMRQLEQREFIRRERRSSVEGEVEYAFRHALVRDAAYNQLPRAERSERHRIAAEWIASLGRTDDHAELVAHHYLEALGYQRAAGREIGALAAPARRALRVAGERALGLASYPQAARFLRIALELTSTDDPDRPELMYRCGLAQLWHDSTGEDILAESVTLLRSAGQPELAARAALVLSRYAWNRADNEASDRWLEVIDQLAADLPESTVPLEALVVRSAFSMLAADFRTAVRTATEALARLGEDGPADLIARSYDVRGVSRCSLGDSAGLADCRKAVQIARDAGSVWQVHHAINNMISGVTQLGRTAEVAELLALWESTFDEVGGLHYSRQWYLCCAAEHAFTSGDWATAVELWDTYFRGIPPGQTHILESNVLPQRALVHHARGEDSEARADIERALEVAHQLRDPQNRVAARCVGAALAIEAGDRARAEAEWADLLAIGDPLANTLAQVEMIQFAWLALDLDHVDTAREVVRRCDSPVWRRLASLILDGAPEAAADELERMDRATPAAYCRMRAGGKQLAAARAFYASVGATRYTGD
jgi:class 3 adenylate cyclase